jgi:hypothetical protein
MPATTLLDIPPQEQEQMLAALRRARYGYLLALLVVSAKSEQVFGRRVSNQREA